MERDGVVIGIGFVAAVLALVIVTLASAGAVNALHTGLSANPRDHHGCGRGVPATLDGIIG